VEVTSAVRKVARFGAFTFDTRTGELRKQGRLLRVHGQPAEVLRALIEKRGSVVARTELHQRLWAANTYVDFEHGLNKAISKIRSALADPPNSSRYLETVSGEGYRFIAPVEWLESISDIAPPSAESINQSELTVESGLNADKSKRSLWLIAASILLIVLGSLFWYVGHLRSAGIVETELTSRAPELPIEAASISPDGKYIAFADREGLWLQVIETRVMHKLKAPEMFSVTKIAWLPNSTALMVSATTGSEKISCIWEISIFGEEPRELRDDAGQGSPSPDGTEVAFTSGDAAGIWRMTITGEDARKIVGGAEGDQFGSLVWSPDGADLVYNRMSFGAKGYEDVLEWRNLSTGSVAVILSEHALSSYCARRDGSIIYSRMESGGKSRETSLWRFRIDFATGRILEDPKLLTRWSGSASNLSVTADGKTLALEKGFTHLASYALRLGPQGQSRSEMIPLTYHQRDDYPGSWDSSGRAVLLNSNRDGQWEIFKQGLGQSASEYVVGSTANAKYPTVSPDGKWILYQSVPRGTMNSSMPVTELRVAAGGGPPQEVWEGRGTFKVRCTRLPANRCVMATQDADGTHLIIAEFDPAKGKGKELLRIAMKVTSEEIFFSWDISPEGSEIVLCEPGESDTHLKLISLSDGSQNEVVLRGWRQFGAVAWAPDGKTLFVSMGSDNGSTILEASLGGSVNTLMQRNQRIEDCIPSPDGHWLAFSEIDARTNVSLVSGF
jgi:DNA-binding winged helix-turn-helix (wHTH) protein/Tol biopolymer transport system component